MRPWMATIEIRLPEWIGPLVAERNDGLTTVESRMRFVIELARANVERRTGGPFGRPCSRPTAGSLWAWG